MRAGEKPVEEPELITIGCPHCSAAELKKAAELLEGKTVSKEFWIFTSRELAKRYPEHIRTIEKSGAKVVCDTCMVVSPATNSYSCVMVNSGKAFAYVPGMCGAEAVYGSMEACVEEAVGRTRKKGRWFPLNSKAGQFPEDVQKGKYCSPETLFPSLAV